MSKKFNGVSAEAFVGVEGPLKQAGWERFNVVAAWEDAQVLPLAYALIFGGIEAVKQTLIPVDRGALDTAWDRAEQRFTAATLLNASDPDPKVAAAAMRIAATLLWEGGQLGQTKLTYEAEVNFGLTQIEIAGRPEIAQALADAGLTAIFEEVRVATKEFEAGLGRAPDQKKTLAPAHMLRDALRDAAMRFSLAYDMVAALIALTPAGPQADAMRLLLAPLDKLVDQP